MSTTLTPLALSLMLVMSTACSDQEAGKPVTWADLNVETLSLELIDDSRYESFRFGKGGHVAVVIGERNGALAAPIFYWRVEGDHLLIREEEEPTSALFVDLSQPRVEGDILRVSKGLQGEARYAIRKDGEND